MLKRYFLLTVFGAIALGTQVGCVPLAAGVVGAGIGHEIAEQRDEDDNDKD